ncbi:MAG TPA: AAA family ATPase [Thermoleophilaceae bacterium]|nr:AAA family ATPase [Thermoleophilaceae bacterium]
MPTPPSSRSIKIDQDERGGWSSDRPRRDGAPPRPARLAVRCRVLAPAELLRYSPGSLMLVVSPVDAEAERFAQRLIEERAALLSLAKVRGLLAGRVDEEEVEARAAQLLDAAVAKRLEANESVVISVEGLAPETREHYVRMAAAHKRPCHIVLVETPREQVEEDVRPTLNKLRKLLGAGDLGKEGFNTALRVMPNSMSEIKRIVFRPPPRDDD